MPGSMWRGNRRAYASSKARIRNCAFRNIPLNSLNSCKKIHSSVLHVIVDAHIENYSRACISSHSRLIKYWMFMFGNKIWDTPTFVQEGLVVIKLTLYFWTKGPLNGYMWCLAMSSCVLQWHKRYKWPHDLTPNTCTTHQPTVSLNTYVYTHPYTDSTIQGHVWSLNVEGITLHLPYKIVLGSYIYTPWFQKRHWGDSHTHKNWLVHGLIGIWTTAMSI